MSRLEDVLNSAVAGWQGASGAQHGAQGWVTLHMLDGRDHAARLTFESNVERRAGRLDRWLAIIRFEPLSGDPAQVIWLLDARTVQWPGRLPPGGLRAVVTGPNAQETPILWFRGAGVHVAGASFTASGVLGAAGIVDAAEVGVVARRIRRQARLRMVVNPQLWDLSDEPAELRAWMCPRLMITASGALRPFHPDAVAAWL